MESSLLENRPDDAAPVTLVSKGALTTWLAGRDDRLKNWVAGAGFKAKPGTVCLVPDTSGKLACALAGVASTDDPFAAGGLPVSLPEGNYYIDNTLDADSMERLALGWGLGAYRFNRYKDAKGDLARLALDPRCDSKRVQALVESIYLVRDLINTPAEDMMPKDLADAMVKVGSEFGAEVNQVIGDALLEKNFPAIHAVGRASVHAPRFLDLRWGDPAHPKVTLVGKGVCFDSGGLDLKPASGMRLMKKDMGGAAHAIGLGRAVMSTGIPVRLRILVSAVENAVSGNAIRPGDVVRTRKGLTIEIDNTDAEGRVVLSDALAEGAAEKPDLMIDFATLTGAARVAVGTEMAAVFSNSDDVANGLLDASDKVQDPIWRLPLHKPYRELIDSKVADIANSASTPFAGAITAALFLQDFVPPEISWAHFDLMAWNLRPRPGRPEGGEAMGLRAAYEYLSKRYGA